MPHTLGSPCEGDAGCNGAVTVRSFFASDSSPRGALLVLSGSSGRIEKDRVRVLADHGFAALSVQWFGGPGQPPGICEVPLETFAPALDELATYSEHLGVLGTSKGAEAALLMACDEPRIQVVVALSPPSVVWANVGPGLDGETKPYRSSWTRGGVPLPFVSYDEHGWPLPSQRPASLRDMYRSSMEQASPDAQIPAERIGAHVILSAGGDDRMWPSDTFVEQLAARRTEHGLDTEVLVHPHAGHRVILPGERALAMSTTHAHGGSEHADREQGQAVLDAIIRAFER